MAITKKTEGHLTITDLTDITDVYLEYCLALNSANADAVSKRGTASGIAWQTGEISWSTTYPTWVSGYQIWIRQVRIKEGIANPEYGTPYIDTAVNQLNTRISSSETNITALQTKLQRIWINEITNGDYVAGTYAASGINGTTFVESNPQTYGYNTLLRHNALDLRYNTVKMTSLTTAALTFYVPTQDNSNNWIQGNKGLELSADGLKFYNSSGTLTSTFSDTISLASNGASITIGATTTGKYNTYIDSQGLYLRIGTTSYATLTTNGIDFYGYYYPYAGGGTEQRTFGKIASLGENLQIGNTYDNHITIDSTGLSVFSKSDAVNSHVLLGTSNNRVTYNAYKKRFRTTWEYGTQFHYNCTIEGGTASHVFYVENNGKYENTGEMIAIDGTTYIISESGSSTGTTYDYSFSSATNNTNRTVNIIIELTYNSIILGPRFQFGISNNSIGTNSCTIGKGLTALAEDQIVLGHYNKLDFDAAFIIGNGTSDNNRSNLFMVDGNGNLRVNNGFQIYNNDETDSIAEFGTTARIGKINNSHFLMNANSLQAYNSSNQLYFEVSNAGIRFGNNLSSTVATQADVADASYSVEIEVKDIDYVTGKLSLTAHVYKLGVRQTGTNLNNISFNWSYIKNVNNDDVETVLTTSSAYNTQTITINSGAELEATYVCTISEGGV